MSNSRVIRKAIVGHRGVGKTHLLTRSKSYLPEIKHFDLDYEISIHAGKSPSEIFATTGESDFRKLELEVFRKITAENSNFVVSCGAGFDTTSIESSIEVVFASRQTDKDGRIFLDRPRLNPEISQLEEYQLRYKLRQPRFLSRADVIYHMPEGIETPNELEKSIWLEQVELNNAVYTLYDREVSKRFYNKFKYFELRNDLLNENQITQFIENNPQANLLYSVRTENIFQNLTSFQAVDCDIKYAENFKWPETSLKILSTHTDDIHQAIRELNNFGVGTTNDFAEKMHFKLCPVVENFDELIKGYEWQQESPQTRSFLPRSNDGKWVWFRLLSYYLQNLNFVKCRSDAADQPSIYEFLSLPKTRPLFWGAVLGEPVYFSRSPEQHRTFFAELKSFFTRIQLNERELAENLGFLQKLGMKFAAVTSPLKETLYKISDVQSRAALDLKSANTLILEDDFILVHNTDIDGFIHLTSMLKKSAAIAVWGGGGTLSMMRSVLPEAHFFSSQTAERRKFDENKRFNVAKNFELENTDVVDYDFLIWAAPRKFETKWPPKHIKCKTVIDLNYVEYSMGLEYAAMNKLNYITGLAMFKEQALKQQVYWSQGVR